MTLSKRLISSLMFTIIVMSSWLHPVHADGEQIYFVAMVAPLNSISQNTSGTAVYLRWDVIEGRLPADVTQFVLLRDGVEIGNGFPANAVMSPAEIRSMYDKPYNSRRKAEIIRWLQEADSSVNSVNYADVIAAKLSVGGASEDSFWAHFASRIDFLVAMSRYRGFIDIDAVGTVEYTLYAKNIDGTKSRLLGKTVVDTAVVNRIPGVSGFKQVSRYSAQSSEGLGRCDVIAERYKDHGAIALTWNEAIKNISTYRYATSLITAGFDLYRSKDPESNLPTRDIRALAAASFHDADGEVTLDGLVKVNDQPIVISGNPAASPGVFFEPAFFQYLETHKELIDAGIKPGEHRSYYLVARDITGNYGGTVKLEVIVPNLITPPAPWRIDTQYDPVDKRFSLNWDDVNLLNYVQSHQNKRTYCNLNTARFDKVLKFVKEGEDCQKTPQRTVDLDVDSYLIYRFRSSADAAAFSDIDGDGRSDNDERLYDHDNNPATAAIFNRKVIGTACDVNQFPAAASSYLVGVVPANDARLLPSGRKVLDFADITPANETGEVFWYRIATRDSNGFISSLSEPVRALAHSAIQPPRAGLEDIIIGKQSCSYILKQKDNGTGVAFAEDTTGDAALVRFSCDTNITYTSVPGAPLPLQICLDLDQRCLDKIKGEPTNLSISYLNKNGNTLASGFTASVWNSCPNEPKTELIKTCDAAVDPAEPGDIFTGPLFLDFSGLLPQHCLKLYREVGGSSELVQTICPPYSTPIQLNVASMGDQSCFSVAWQDEDGRVSSRYALPCVSIVNPGAPPVAPPGILSLGFDSALAQMSVELLPPEQPLAGSIVEWVWKNPAETTHASRYSDFFPHAQLPATFGIRSLTLDITPEQAGDYEEEWCVRARSVAKTSSATNSDGLSDWSSWLCQPRLPEAGELPSYIPWPHINTAANLGELQALYLNTDQEPVILLANEDLSFRFAANLCSVQNINKCGVDGKDLCLPAISVETTQTADCATLCSSVKSSIIGGSNFVVYRQRASNVNQVNSYKAFIQVSPLINHVSCNATYKGSKGGGTTVSELADPYIALADFSGDPAWDGTRPVYRDHHPLISGNSYRYQLVYFDENHEITGYRWTDWITVP